MRPLQRQETQPLLVTGSYDRTLRIWDMDTGVTLRVLEGHLAGVTGSGVHAQGAGRTTQVFSASKDGTVRRWDIAPLPHQHLLDVPGDARAAAIAPDGTRVAVGFDDGSLRLYTLPAGRLVAEVEERARGRDNSSRLRRRRRCAGLGQSRQQRQALVGRGRWRADAAADVHGPRRFGLSASPSRPTARRWRQPATTGGWDCSGSGPRTRDDSSMPTRGSVTRSRSIRRHQALERRERTRPPACGT